MRRPRQASPARLSSRPTATAVPHGFPDGRQLPDLFRMLPRQVFRANIVAYFVTLQVTAFPLLVSNGIMTRHAFTSGVLLLPGLIAGA